MEENINYKFPEQIDYKQLSNKIINMKTHTIIYKDRITKEEYYREVKQGNNHSCINFIEFNYDYTKEEFNLNKQ